MKVFISSTCYDLEEDRRILEKNLKSLGYSVALSENEDFLYNPDEHSHLSCVKKVKDCDLLIFIISKRYGGTIVPEALIDLKKIEETKSVGFFENLEAGKISITQAEVLTAFKHNIPVYTFIDSTMLDHHLIYEKAKKNGEDMTVIERTLISAHNYQDGYIKHIFEFFNYIRLKKTNNTYFKYSNIDNVFEIFKTQNILRYKSLLKIERENKQNESIVPNKNLVSALIVKSNSPQREDAFDDLYFGTEMGYEIRILGTGATRFLNKTSRVEGLLERGNDIKVLLVNNKIIKNDWICKGEDFLRKIQGNIEINCDDDQICPLSILNILIEKNHFLNYQGKGSNSKEKSNDKDSDKKKEYMQRMKEAYDKCEYYKKRKITEKWKGKFQVEHFYSFIPMSMTAVIPKKTLMGRMVVEFIIPFTENRIVFQCSQDKDKQLYDTFMNFYDSTWKKSVEKKKKINNVNIAIINK